MMSKVLWAVTLPFFLAAWAFTMGLEGAIWLAEYPARSWAQIKEWLGK
jgi:hypothetical protein